MECKLGFINNEIRQYTVPILEYLRSIWNTNKKSTIIPWIPEKRPANFGLKVIWLNVKK